MARIRTIKPDFWTDEKIVELEPWVRLLFIGLWTFADDEGYLAYSPRRIKMQVFPADTLDVSRGLKSLLEKSLIALYDSDRGLVIKITHWLDHQKPNHPTPSKILDWHLVETTVEEHTAEELGFVSTQCQENYGNNTLALRPEREREGEREREVVLTSRTHVTSATEKFSDPSNHANRIITGWLDTLNVKPPGKVVADATVQIKAMLSEGIDEHFIIQGINAWWSGKYPASTLPNYVAVAQNQRGGQRSTGTQRAMDILSIDTSSIPERLTK